MKRANWLGCCAVVGLSLTVAPVAAQENDPFGLEAQAKATVEQTEAAEQSVVKNSELATFDAAGDAADDDFCQCVGESEASSVAKIEHALRNPLKPSGVEFSGVPLKDVMEVLETDYGIPVELDRPAMEEIGIDAQEPVAISVHGISLQAALRLLLKPLQLTYIIRNEVLMITTPEEAESQLVTCVYDLRAVGKSTDAKSVDQLVDAIVSCVATETWAENGGGNARICSVDPGLLVIAQTRAVHEEIRSLLSTIRAVRQRPAATAGASKRDPAVSDEEAVVTRAYSLQLGDAAEPEAVRQQIRSLITSSLPDAQWAGQLDDGQHVLLTVLPDRIVLRHKRVVQEAVGKLLADSGVAEASPRIDEEGPTRGNGGPYGGGYFGHGEGMMGGRGGNGGGYGAYGGGRGYGGEGGMMYGGRGGYGGAGMRGGYGAGGTIDSAEEPTPGPNENE